MKSKNILAYFLILTSILIKAQNNPSVEKSIFSFQIGTVGAWFQNETKLSNTIALRTEIGLETDITYKVGFFIAPEITLEPRWYYNIKKRAQKKRDISNNSANFFTVKTSFRSDVFEISNYYTKRARNTLYIIPKWGIKRNIGVNFNYELGFGLGYFSESYNEGPIAELHMRIGYNF
jgi:hypothetical protein